MWAEGCLGRPIARWASHEVEALGEFSTWINEVELPAFGDASGHGVAAAVYTIVHQDSGITQGLVAAKARLVKQRMSIPRLELVAGHKAANSMENVRRALNRELKIYDDDVDDNAAKQWYHWLKEHK